MAKNKNLTDSTPEISAISAVYTALKGLDPAVQIRVLRYSAEMLGLASEVQSSGDRLTSERNVGREAEIPSGGSTTIIPDAQPESDVDGINAVALKWMRRSGLDPKSLQTLFSLGIDEIDLVAKSVPGKSKKERMRSVLLLKGIAAYLGTGAPRITYEQLKEACLHYNAYDAPNFATYLKAFQSDVGGTKEAGFTLTARGLTSGTELVKELLTSK